ncbi:DUF1758 domain-containing protein, partial [Aphis craccivora]
MEATTAKKVKLAKKRQNQVKHELSTTTLFGTQYDTTSGNLNEVRIRLEALNTLSEKYEMAQIEIEELDDSVDDDQQCDEYIDFKNKFYHAKAVLMQLIDANSNNTSSSPSFSELTKYKTENTMRLPPVEIPKCDGDWQCWTSFIDSFNIVFHNHESFAPVQKFHYLKGYLVGQASDVIRSIPTTGENYLQAYNTLMNRYDNKCVIIQSHIRSLLDTPKVLIASATNLEKLQHHIMSNVNALRALRQPIE